MRTAFKPSLVLCTGSQSNDTYLHSVTCHVHGYRHGRLQTEHAVNCVQFLSTQMDEGGDRMDMVQAIVSKGSTGRHAARSEAPTHPPTTHAGAYLKIQGWNHGLSVI